MSKIGTVFKFETIRQLKKPSFWVSLLLLPLAIFAIVGLSTLGGYNAGSSLMDGADLSGKTIGLTNDSPLFPDLAKDLGAWFSSDDFATDARPTLVKIDSRETGINQVISGELNAYYYFPADARDTKTAEVYQRAAETNLMTDFSVPLSDFLSKNTINKLPADQQIAIYGLIQFNKTVLDDQGETTNPAGDFIIPIAILAIFYVLICIFGNRLTMALIEEKENRISEMILTAVSPKKLVIGKILSLIALGFVQIAVFIIPIIATLIIYRDNEMIASILGMITVNPWLLISNILLLLVSYFFLAGTLTFVGSLVPTARDASSYSGIAVIMMIMPLFFLDNIISGAPDLITYILSYFPFSAPITMMLRNAFGGLPTYELIISIIELALCSAGILSLTVKSFQKNAINFSVVRLNLKPRKTWKK